MNYPSSLSKKCDSRSQRRRIILGEWITSTNDPAWLTFVSRSEFHYTPKHGSWLDIAENELNCLTRQYVSGRRIGSEDELRSETTAWAESTNTTQRSVDWQMKIDDARIKLKSVFPKIR
jgi:hypothetical protein